MPAIIDEWHWKRGGTTAPRHQWRRCRSNGFLGIHWLEKGFSATPVQEPEMHIDSFSPPPFHWIFHCKLEPKFLLHSYHSLAVLRLHDTMATINLDSIKFYQPPSAAEPTGKNPIVIYRHIGETAQVVVRALGRHFVSRKRGGKRTWSRMGLSGRGRSWLSLTGFRARGVS